MNQLPQGQPQEAAPWTQQRPLDLGQFAGIDRSREAAIKQEKSPYGFLKQIREQSQSMFGPQGGGF